MAIDPTRHNGNEILVGYVIAGHGDKADPNQLGLSKIGLIQRHGLGVKEEHLGYSQMLMPPNQSGATEFNGVPDLGQAVVCLKSGPPGASDLLILGCLPEYQLPGGQAGNRDVKQSVPIYANAVKEAIEVLIPPQIREVIRDGARIREIVEKGQKHKHELLKGIPSHGAIYSLAGVSQKQLTNISTATQAFSNILTSSMMSALPGNVFSIGNLLNSLTSSALDELLSSMPPAIALGTQSLFNLMQTIETVESGGFNTMGKVDPATYIANAVNLLKGNQSLGEVVSNLQRMQVDTSLFGVEKLGNATFDIPTAFGVTKMILSPTGEIINELPDAVQKGIEAFNTLMTSGIGFPNGTLSNMFGDSASVMSSLFDRLPPEKQTNAKNMMEGVIAPGTNQSKLLTDVANLAHFGKNLAELF
jgi:hypothetical protein